MEIDYSKFRPTHAVLYKGQKILVQSIDDGEFATEQDSIEAGGMIGSFAIDEENEDMPTSQVWILDEDSDIVCYKDAESKIELIKICIKCYSSQVVKNGKTQSGYQRWHCKDCDRTTTKNKVGRPCDGVRPMTSAERKRKQRKRNK